MPNVEKAKLIERVKKLLALSTSPNENEAAAAAEKAQALIAEYNLSMAEVKAWKDMTKGDEVGDDFVIRTSDKRTDSRPWRRTLGVMVAKMYFCKYYFSFVKEAAHRKNGYIRYDLHNFIGAEHNVEVAQMMFDYLVATVDRLAREGASRISTQKVSYITSFQHACAQRLARRIHDRIEHTKRKGIQISVDSADGGVKNLPALASLYDEAERRLQAFTEQQMKLRTHKRRTELRNIQGTIDGDEAGKTIGLDGQVGGRGRTAAIGHG